MERRAVPELPDKAAWQPGGNFHLPPVQRLWGEQVAVSGRKRTLLLFTLTRMDSMLQKGNVWYLRHYESYFDRVYVAYLLGVPLAPRRNGKTVLISLGRGGTLVNLLFAPYKLFLLARKIKPTAFLTADIFFSWWTALFVRFLLTVKVYLLPVCRPEQIYRSTGKSSTGLPISLERLFSAMCYRSAYRILSVEYCSEWLKNHRLIKEKLIVYDVDPESLPTPEFYKSLSEHGAAWANPLDPEYFNLIYVGRLHCEKFVDEIFHMAAELNRMNVPPFMLNLVGDGAEKKRLAQLAIALGIEDRVKFLGSIENRFLPRYLVSSNLFVSTVTGTSLREAALCGLPIIAYDFEWVSDCFEHGKNAYLTVPHDYVGLAQGVANLMTNAQLRASLGAKAKELATEIWSPDNLRKSLSLAFNS